MARDDTPYVMLDSVPDEPELVLQGYAVGLGSSRSTSCRSRGDRHR